MNSTSAKMNNIFAFGFDLGKKRKDESIIDFFDVLFGHSERKCG